MARYRFNKAIDDVDEQTGGMQPSDVYRYEDALSLEEIEASTDVSENIPNAQAVKELKEKFGNLEFGQDGDGNYGYYKADGSFVPFKVSINTLKSVTNGNLEIGKTYIVFSNVKTWPDNNGSLSISNCSVLFSEVVYNLSYKPDANYNYFKIYCFLIRATSENISFNTSGTHATTQFTKIYEL